MVDSKEFKVNFHHIFLVLFSIGWYYTTLMVVILLKYFLEDRNCSKHPNSVSGHFNIVVFSFLTLVHLKFHNQLNPKLKLLYFLSFIVSLISSIIMLIYTYFHGYHSIRQIIYGTSTAIISFTLYSNIHPLIEKDLLLMILFGFWMIVTVSMFFYLNFFNVLMNAIFSILFQGFCFILHKTKIVKNN